MTWFYDTFDPLPERTEPPVGHLGDCECDWCEGRRREGLPR